MTFHVLGSTLDSKASLPDGPPALHASCSPVWLQRVTYERSNSSAEILSEGSQYLYRFFGAVTIRPSPLKTRP